MIKKISTKIGLLLLMVGFGTCIDWFVHNSDPEYAVPDYYFRNKIIFGVFWAFIFAQLYRKIGDWRVKAVLVPLSFVGLLQFNYYFQGYSLDFVISFMFVHFFAFLPASFFIYYYYDKELSA